MRSATSRSHLGVVRTKNLARDWYAAQCAAIFGPERAWPNATDFGARYNGLRQNATRVFYSAGSQNAWTQTCVTEDSGVPPACMAHTIVGNEMG